MIQPKWNLSSCRNRVYELTKPWNIQVQQPSYILFFPLGRVGKQVPWVLRLSEYPWDLPAAFPHFVPLFTICCRLNSEQQQYTAHWTLHNAQFTMHNAHCTMHTAQCTPHTAHQHLHLSGYTRVAWCLARLSIAMAGWSVWAVPFAPKHWRVTMGFRGQQYSLLVWNSNIVYNIFFK